MWDEYCRITGKAGGDQVEITHRLQQILDQIKGKIGETTTGELGSVSKCNW